MRLTEVVQSHDLVVNQPGENLALEAHLVDVLLGPAMIQQFDGDIAPEQLIGRTVDRAHAPLAEFLVQNESLVKRCAYANHPISPSRVEKGGKVMSCQALMPPG